MATECYISNKDHESQIEDCGEIRNKTHCNCLSGKDTKYNLVTKTCDAEDGTCLFQGPAPNKRCEDRFWENNI